MHLRDDSHDSYMTSEQGGGIVKKTWRGVKKPNISIASNIFLIIRLSIRGREPGKQLKGSQVVNMFTYEHCMYGGAAVRRYERDGS